MVALDRHLAVVGLDSRGVRGSHDPDAVRPGETHSPGPSEERI